MSPIRILQIRKNLGLLQVEAGKIIGGGPRAFQKYESGRIVPSKAMINLLLILEKFPDAINVLKDEG